MTSPGRRNCLFVALAIGLFSALRAIAAEHAPMRPPVEAISLGIVSQIHRGEIEERYRDFVRYVNRKLPSGSEYDSKIIFVSTALELAKLLKEKKVDFYMESPYLTFLVNTTGTAKLLLRRWKGNASEYRSIVFTKKDGQVRHLHDLRGKIIAFEDPESTSGYFLPRIVLQKNGLGLIRMLAPNPSMSPLETAVPPTRVGYVFAYSQDILLDLVLTKHVAAGAMGSHDLARLDAKDKADISILAESEALPRHLVSVRSGLAQPSVNRLKEILLSMHQDPEGRKVLHKADQTSKFDVFPGGEAMMRGKLAEIFSDRGRH